MKATRAFALMANFCLLNATVDRSESTEESVKARLRPSRHMLPNVPFCSRLCNGGAGRFADEMFPPYRCSCSRSCAVYGDCCYDSPYRIEELGLKHEFVCISVVERSGYRAVSSCTHATYRHSCKAKLGQLPPVTSIETNITYANRYCARCNLETSYITWNVDLSCPPSEDGQFSDPNNLIEYRSNKFWLKNILWRTKRLCKFEVRNGDFRTIDGLELRPYVSVEKISKCSPSWEDLASAKKCGSYEDPVFLYNTVYRNPDCAHCNFINLSYVECVPHQLKTTMGGRIVDDDVIRYCLTHSCNLDLSNGGAISISSLFDLYYRSEPVSLCPERQRYDPNTNKCKKIRH